MNIEGWRQFLKDRLWAGDTLTTTPLKNTHLNLKFFTDRCSHKSEVKSFAINFGRKSENQKRVRRHYKDELVDCGRKYHAGKLRWNGWLKAEGNKYFIFSWVFNWLTSALDHLSIRINFWTSKNKQGTACLRNSCTFFTLLGSKQECTGKKSVSIDVVVSWKWRQFNPSKTIQL